MHTTKDKKIGGSFYAVMTSPVDGSVWGATRPTAKSSRSSSEASHRSSSWPSEGRLADNDIWNIVNYIRSVAVKK